ncbi:DUF6318 family protein [Cellulomonas septica]|nr:DUF6318 family protein [Cellulomonas septica]
MSNRARGHGRVSPAVTALVATLVVVAAGACTAEPTPTDPVASPRETATLTPDASPTTTPTPDTPGTIAALPDGVKPERPAAMDSPPTVEGSTAVAAYFVQLFPYAVQTNDVADFAALSHAECGFCSSTQADVARQIERGERTIGGGIAVSSVTATEVVPQKHFAVHLTIDEAPSHEENEFGMVVNDDPERETYSVEMALLYEDGKWLVRAVDSEVVTA